MRPTLSWTTMPLAAAFLALTACEPAAVDGGSDLATREGAARIAACAGGVCEGVGAACAHDAECGAGLACNVTTSTCKAAGTTDTVCAGAGSCAAGHTCDSMLGLCRLDVATPAWPRVLNGAITGPTGPCVERVDIDGDGASDIHTTYTYDPNGYVIMAEESMGSCAFVDAQLVVAHQRLACTGPDGTVTRRTQWGRDGLGRVRTVSMDYDADGVWDERTTYGYLADGRLQTTKVDLGVDDTVDAITTWTWDGFHVASTSMDKDADGQPERVIEYTWDDDGYLVEQSEDNDGDGLADAVTAWEYGAAGLPALREWDGYGAWVLTNPECGTGSTPKGADGITDKRVQWTWDAAGRMVGEKTVWFMVNKGFSGSFLIYDPQWRVHSIVRQGLEPIGTTDTCQKPLMGISQQTWTYDWTCGG